MHASLSVAGCCQIACLPCSAPPCIPPDRAGNPREDPVRAEISRLRQKAGGTCGQVGAPHAARTRLGPGPLRIVLCKAKEGGSHQIENVSLLSLSFFGIDLPGSSTSAAVTQAMSLKRRKNKPIVRLERPGCPIASETGIFRKRCSALERFPFNKSASSSLILLQAQQIKMNSPHDHFEAVVRTV